MNPTVKMAISSVAGATAAVLIAKKMMKTKNTYVMVGIGIAGALVGNMICSKLCKSSVPQMASTNNEFEPQSGMVDFEFNPEVGYATPHGTMTMESPESEFDLSF